MKGINCLRYELFHLTDRMTEARIFPISSVMSSEQIERCQENQRSRREKTCWRSEDLLFVWRSFIMVWKKNKELKDCWIEEFEELKNGNKRWRRDATTGLDE